MERPLGEYHDKVLAPLDFPYKVVIELTCAEVIDIQKHIEPRTFERVLEQTGEVAPSIPSVGDECAFLHGRSLPIAHLGQH